MTKIRPNSDAVHMIYDIEFLQKTIKCKIRIVEKRYAQAVSNMELVYRKMQEIQSPDAKLFVLTLNNDPDEENKPVYRFNHKVMK